MANAEPMGDMPHLLLVDDERSIREPLAQYLTKQGFRVTQAADAESARTRLAAYAIDLVILDVMMPGEDGLSLCRHIAATSDTPVILLTAKAEETDRIVGLEMGADDYVAKPANPRELLARVRSVLRRHGERGGERGGERIGGRPAAPPVRPLQRFSGWRLDGQARQLFDPDDVVINLSDGEFRLLMTLVGHPRRVLTRDFLLDHARGPNAEHFDRAIDVQVSRLRRKLARSDGRGGDDLIRTVRNEGYMFAADVETR